MIYFLRHGLDDETYIGGWSDVDLTKVGIEQVREICHVLERLPIKKIISSDIKRARTTAQIVSEYLNIPVEYSSDYRELNKGDLTGLNKDVALTLYPDYIDNVGVDTRYPNGESLIDLYKRISELISIIDTYDEVLIVTHRGVINMVYFLMNNRLPDNNKKQFGVTHASVHEYDNKNKVIRKVDK